MRRSSAQSEFEWLDVQRHVSHFGLPRGALRGVTGRWSQSSWVVDRMKMDKQLQKEIEQLIEQRLKKGGASDPLAKEVERLRKTVDALSAKLEGLVKASGKESMQVEVDIKKLQHEMGGFNQKIVAAMKNVGAEIAAVEQKIRRAETHMGTALQHVNGELQKDQRGLNLQMSRLNERVVKLEKGR